MRLIDNTTAFSITALILGLSLPSIATAQNGAGAAAYPPGPTRSSAPATVLGGQPPKVFYACYIPTSGVTYRIKEVDIKQTCASDHVMFSWTDGGIPGPQGPKGDPGPQGPQGAKGDPGQSGFTQTQLVLSGEVTAPVGGSAVALATCPAGWLVVGGGFNVGSYTAPVPPFVSGSRPEGVDAWLVGMWNTAPGAVGNAKVSAYAICAK